MNRLFVLLLVLYAGELYSQPSTNPQKAREITLEAIEKTDAGEYEAALELLEEAEKLDPGKSLYPYEKAYVYYVQKEYDKAIRILEKLTKYKDTSDLVFQLLGNSYDLNGQSKKALSTYEKGLKHFPNSGKLYLELGILSLAKEAYHEAIDYWEQGVEVEPSFPSNYYWLSKIFSYTDERIWSVLYGEVFMNLERNTQRTEEMSEILMKIYREAIYVNSDTSVSADFTRVFAVPDGQEFEPPFAMAYSTAIMVSLPVKQLAQEEKLSIASLLNIRKNFLDLWYTQGYNKNYPNLLFDYQKTMKENLFLEAYTYWIFMRGDQEEFSAWYQENESLLDEFIKWFTDNPLKVDKKNYFSRTRN